MINTTTHIRPFQTSDALPIFQAVRESLAEVSPWMAALNASLTHEEIQSYIAAQPELRAEREAYNFAIARIHDDGFLGGCGLTNINWQHRLANLYYWVRSSQTRQGSASTATLLLARFGFATLALQRIEIVMATSNFASIRVAEKVGATHEGRLRNRINVHGALHDAFIYSLIPMDLP